MLPMSRRVAVKGPRQLWDCADLDNSFTSLKSVYLNSKSNSRRIHVESSSILPSVSFDLRYFTGNLFLSIRLLIL